MVLAGGTTMVCGGEKCGERTVNNLQGEAPPYTQTHSFPHRTLIETFNFTVGLEGQLCLSNLQLYHGQKKCMKWHLLKSVTLGKGTHWSFQIAVRNYPIFFHICTQTSKKNWLALCRTKRVNFLTGLWFKRRKRGLPLASVLLDLFVFWLLFEFHVGEKGEYKETQWTQRRRFSSWPAYHDTYSFVPLIILKYG